MSMSNETKTFGFTDAELLAEPTVFDKTLLQGKTVLVSGAGSGLGRAIALLCGRLGANMVICGRDAKKLDGIQATLKGLGVQVDSRAMTIRDPEMVNDFITGVFDRHRNLDVLVNNAGGQFPQPAIDYTVKGWNAVIDTNLNGTWYMMQAAARQWRDRKLSGNIVNIVAVVERGLPDLAHTCAARAGVIGLSRTVAVEWAPLEIRVNCVAPGCVETEGFGLYPPEAAWRYQHTSNPMLRAGHPMDVAESVVYLAAPSGKFITGEVIDIDGGQRMWGEFWGHSRPAWAKME
jgi:citronellol/citronellal dehydrogenase